MAALNSKSGAIRKIGRRRTWSYHVVVLQRTAKKYTKIYNARAQLLFCSLNLLFGDVPVEDVGLLELPIIAIAFQLLEFRESLSE